MKLYRYFPVYQAEEYKKGIKLIPSKDTVKLMFRGGTAEEALNLFKDNLTNYLNRTYNMDITKVRLVDYPLDVLEEFDIADNLKDKFIRSAIPASDLTVSKLKIINEIKDKVNHNVIASVIYTCLKDYYLGLDVVPMLSKNGYPSHFLNCLGNIHRARVARGTLPTTQLLVSHLLLFPQEYDEVMGAYKAHLVSLLASMNPEGKYPSFIKKSRTGLSKRLIERYGSLNDYLAHKGFTHSYYIGILNRRKPLCDEKIAEIAQDAEWDMYDVVYSNLIDMVDYLLKYNYKKMGLIPRPSQPKRQTTEETTHDEPQGVFSLEDFDI